MKALLTSSREEIVPGMAFPKYRQSLGLNASVIKRGIKSPKHLLHAYCDSQKDTDAMLWGRAAHCLLLEPREFERRYKPFSGTRRGKVWEQFRRECEDEGAEPMKEDQFESVIAAGTAWLADPLVRAEVAGAQPEVSLFTVECGLQCKARVDAYLGDSLIDVKTTSAIGHRDFGRQFESLGYHIQLGLYEHWLRRLLGRYPPLRVTVVCVENTPPYDTVVRVVDPELLYLGREKGLSIIAHVRECIESDCWPGVGGGQVHGIQFPEWAMEEEDEFQEGVYA